MFWEIVLGSNKVVKKISVMACLPRALPNPPQDLKPLVTSYELYGKKGYCYLHVLCP